MKTLVIGLGNPILRDDGVGLRVAEALEARLEWREATVIGTSLAGLDLLDTLTGYDRAIIIDAIQTGRGKPGEIYRLDVEALKNTRHAASIHDVNLATALELGRRLGLDLPRQIDILAVEVADTGHFSEECTPEVAKAVPRCVEMIVEELKGNGTARTGDAASGRNLSS
jgi:hydrogenase maturation protease